MRTIDWFNKYTDLGLKVIPLHPRTKIPISMEWYTVWCKDRCHEAFCRNPSLNMGMVLGDVIDVEGDTPEAEELISKIVKDYPHPMYRSLRSTHHIFINPKPCLTLKKVKGIEFRANKHQSVMPPSIHESGVKYAWVRGTTFPIPKMPDELIELLEIQEKYESQIKIKPGHMRLWCSMCQKMQFIHAKRHSLEKQVFQAYGLSWQCRKCRQIDVRPMCRKLKKKQKN